MNRKEAAKEFKGRKVPKGIFAVRCSATGEAWVDSSPNLGAARNGTWFQLRIGTHRGQRLQAEWNAHGEEAFEFEVLETLDDDAAPLLLRDLLKDKKAHWAAKLSAEPL